MTISPLCCPWCGSPLRIRDRALSGQTVPCPDCQQAVALQFSRNPTDHWVAGKPVASSAVGSAPRRTFSLPGEWKARFRAAFAWLESPLVLGSLLAGATAIGGWLLIFGRGESPPGSSAESARIANPPDHSQQEVTPPFVAVTPKAITTQDRFEQLAQRLGLPLDETSALPPAAFPAEGLRVEDRWSWLAGLQRSHPTAAGVNWEHAWHDPRHDRFVRRRVEEFQNPSLAVPVGDDGRPATHFVGVSGVGTDAAELPQGHPRAGAFGWNRTTKRDDFRDGVSQTMIVAGVNRRLGSWAAGGAPSARAFKEEPYVNGPDGFGTGQLESMQVLMADGSVRTISRAMEPTLVRRMAALADGLPLDAAIPGDPGSSPTMPAVPQPPIVVPPVAEKPAVVIPPVKPVAVVPPTVNIPRALALKIVSFRQPKPVPVRELLDMLEELLGCPIRVAAAHRDELTPKLQKPITLTLKESTAADLLRAVLQPIDADYMVVNGAIELMPHSGN